MKVFDKINDFLIDYEDLIKVCLVFFLLFVLCLHFTTIADKNLTRDKNIIENTKNYSVYKNCKSFENEFYCWND